MAKPLWGRRSLQDHLWSKFHPFIFRVILRLDIFQEDQLLIADPKALQRIFTMVDRYPMPRLPRTILKMLVGKGISWAKGT